MILEHCKETEPLMVQAWVDCLMWAIGQKDIIDAFRSDTGIMWRPASNPIHKMIDDATGAEGEFVKRFTEWFNESVWGDSRTEVSR